MSNSQPLVSIVTPVYNGSKYLEELIRSVLDQDYPHLEHIIIDDGSTDNGATVAILQRYAHLRWWTRPNRGAYATINEGLAATTGDLVTVICSDDKYASSDALSTAVKCWAADPTYDAVYGETILIQHDGQSVPYQGPRSGPLWMFGYWTVVTHCSLLVRRDTLAQRNLWFDLSVPFGADYDWIMRMIRGGCRFHRLRRPIAMFRQHPTQRSQTETKTPKERKLLEDRYGRRSPWIALAVRQWVRLVRVKNLIAHYGPLGAVRQIRELRSDRQAQN